MINKTLSLLLLLFILPASISEAQLFRRSSGGSSYGETDYGYNYRGKKYVLGVDGPVSATCPCPMCQKLRAALAAQPMAQVTQQIQHIAYQPQDTRIEYVTKDVYTEDIATPQEAIEKMLAILNPEHNSVLLDPGCGDARILIYGANHFNTRGIGLEINKSTYEKAIKEVEEEGMSKRINLFNVDSTTQSFVNADNVALFLFPSLIEKLAPKFLQLKSGAKVISYQHTIPLPGVEKVGDFYIWIKE